MRFASAALGLPAIARGLLASAALAVACAPPPEPPALRAGGPPLPGAQPPAPEARIPPAAPAREARDTLALITDHAALRAVEARGHTLGQRLDGQPGSNAELAARPRFKSLIEAIEAEVASIQRADARSGVGVGDKPHRLFDVRYLRAGDARFELAGVVNRVDRVAFTKEAGCGEVRLVYRLAYAKASAGKGAAAGFAMASRLPATVAIELLARDPGGGAGCRAAAAAWRAPAGLSGAALGEWLAGDEGPLAPARVAAYEIGAVTLNAQTVRWPSAIRPDLGGHAEYLLRSFRAEPGGGLAPKPLENTPDVARLRQDPALRKELLAWIAEPASLDAIDAGAPVLPERFLATRAISVSPRGLARRHNRPFRQLFHPKELAGAPLSGRREIGSPAALLRRLDELTCQGCHQTRSVAGFHLLGEEAPGSRSANALAVAFSPHVGGELARRRAITEALARGEAADLRAPFAERSGSAGERGAHCGLGDPGFAGWTCDPGLACVEDDVAADAVEVGVCMPPGPGRAGDPCEIARVAPDESGRRDRVARVTPRACGERAVCDRNDVGFPGGMCATSCDDVDAARRAAPGEKPRGVCGRIPILTGFNDCLARKIPFEQCIADNVRPAGLAACDAAMPCRDDYVCARTASGEGACMPPYFLFQLRVDGHPPGGG